MVGPAGYAQLTIYFANSKPVRLSLFGYHSLAMICMGEKRFRLVLTSFTYSKLDYNPLLKSGFVFRGPVFRDQVIAGMATVCAGIDTVGCFILYFR